MPTSTRPTLSPLRLTSTPETPALPRLGREFVRHTHGTSKAFDRVRPGELPEDAAKRIGCSPAHVVNALSILNSLSFVLGPRFKDKLDRTRLPLSIAKQIASPVPMRLVNEVRQGRTDPVTVLAWTALRDNPPATTGELKDIGAGDLSRQYRGALKNLAAALRFFGHDPRSMPLDVALHVYREEVVARRLLPLYSQEYDASKVELWAPVVPRCVKNAGEL